MITADEWVGVYAITPYHPVQHQTSKGVEYNGGVQAMFIGEEKNTKTAIVVELSGGGGGGGGGRGGRG